MAPVFRRYGIGARWYDRVSGERLVYGAGRAAGIRLLAPRAGDSVVDLGCGTGLNFAALVETVGPGGFVLGIDRSTDMLAMAERRIAERGWAQVRLIQADAATLDQDRVRDLLSEATGRDHADALIATYALSVIERREDAWARACGLLRAGARASIVDMQVPTGPWRALAPLARLACAAGGSDIRSHPWQMLERSAVASTVRRETCKGGHIVAVAAELRT